MRKVTMSVRTTGGGGANVELCNFVFKSGHSVVTERTLFLSAPTSRRSDGGAIAMMHLHTGNDVDVTVTTIRTTVASTELLCMSK